jgi:5-methylcytosine-specific restriction endonuclease McrA
MADSFLKIILTKDGKIHDVAHVGRTIPARLRTSVHQNYPECVVQGCRETKGLEIDHVVSLAKGGATSLENLVRLCSHHHRLKTYRGFLLTRVKGNWMLFPPQNAQPTRASPE